MTSACSAPACKEPARTTVRFTYHGAVTVYADLCPGHAKRQLSYSQAKPGMGQADIVRREGR